MSGILALDPSRVTGWAHAVPGGPIDHGQHVLGTEGAAAGKIGQAMVLFLTAMIDVTKPDLLVYEQPWLDSAFRFETAFNLMGLAFTIDTLAEMNGIEYASVTSQAAVTALTGQTKFPGANYQQRRVAKKKATVAACRAMGLNIRNADEADAIAILLLAERKRYPIEARTRPMVLRQPKGPLFAAAE